MSRHAPHGDDDAIAGEFHERSRRTRKQGTRQNRSNLHAKADVQPRCFGRKTLGSAECSGDFRRTGKSEKTTPETGLLATLPALCTEREKSLEIQPLMLSAYFLRVYFYINLPSTLSGALRSTNYWNDP